MPQNFWHIHRCNLFSNLSEEVARRLESRSRLRDFDRGEPIYLPADSADGVLLLTRGRVRICHVTPEGKQSILVFIEPGEIFGELALVDDSPRNEYAEAAEKCEVVLIPKNEIMWLMQQYADVSFGITRLIGLRRQRIEKRLRNLLFRSNRERLILLLLELVEYYGEDIDGATQLKLKLSHQELANIIGSTRETVTVVLGKLQTEGYLEIARRRIRIKDLPGLAREVAEVVSESTSPEPTKQFTRQNAEHAVPPSNSKRKLSIL